MERVLNWQWPRDFPVVQFPNAPLLAAFAFTGVARLTDGTARDIASAAATVGYGAWAVLELVDGDNWFRRLVGAAGCAWVVTRVV